MDLSLLNMETILYCSPYSFQRGNSESDRSVLQWWSLAVTAYGQGDYAVQFHSSPTPARSTVTDVPNKFITSPSTAPTSLPRLIHCAAAINLFRELSPLTVLPSTHISQIMKLNRSHNRSLHNINKCNIRLCITPLYFSSIQWTADVNGWDFMRNKEHDN